MQAPPHLSEEGREASRIGVERVSDELTFGCRVSHKLPGFEYLHVHGAVEGRAEVVLADDVVCLRAPSRRYTVTRLTFTIDIDGKRTPYVYYRYCSRQGRVCELAVRTEARVLPAYVYYRY